MRLVGAAGGDEGRPEEIGLGLARAAGAALRDADVGAAECRVRGHDGEALADRAAYGDGAVGEGELCADRIGRALRGDRGEACIRDRVVLDEDRRAVGVEGDFSSSCDTVAVALHGGAQAVVVQLIALVARIVGEELVVVRVVGGAHVLALADRQRERQQQAVFAVGAVALRALARGREVGEFEVAC